MIATAKEPTTVLADDLVLVRLLPPAKRAPAPGRVRNDLALFHRERPSDDHWQETLDGLVHAGLLTAKPLGLTDAGRARALHFLGVSELPPRSAWATIQAKFLLPKALGLAPTDQATIKKIGKADKLAATLLARRFELAAGPGAGLDQVVEALVCRKLGFPEAANFRDLRAFVLSGLVGSDERLDDKSLMKQLRRVLLRTKKDGLAGLREAALRGWADGAASLPTSLPSREMDATRETRADGPEPTEFDLPAFARTVKAGARDCPTGRFGDNKVFIAHVWRRLRDEPGFPAMDLATFKSRLTEANNARLLTLSRADLVQVMDGTDVNESHTEYLNSEFHFVLLEKEQP